MTEDCCCSSLTAKVAVDTERHSVGGLMDQRPADLESCSEYWSPPNIDVSVLAWETQRKGDKGNRWIVGYLRVRTQWYPRQTNFSFFFFFFFGARECLCIYAAANVYAFVHLYIPTQLSASAGVFLSCAHCKQPAVHHPGLPASYQSTWC